MRSAKKILVRYRQALLTVGIISVLLIAFLIFNGIGHHKSQPGLAQLKQVTGEVSKVMFLPQDETPTLATVSNVSKLKSQAVFANAQNGDKVLVYAKAQKVIVYRPSAHKIVDVGPLILDKNGSPYVTAKVAILNGSGNENALAKMTQSVITAFPNANIVVKQPASRSFPNTIAIDLTKKNQPLDEQIADTLGIKTGQLPLGITLPASADILIIVGQDYAQ